MLLDESKCMGCGICADICPSEAIVSSGSYSYRIDQSLCTNCGLCLKTADCPGNALKEDIDG